MVDTTEISDQAKWSNTSDHRVKKWSKSWSNQLVKPTGRHGTRTASSGVPFGQAEVEGAASLI
jgi:hypothetical protein